MHVSLTPDARSPQGPTPPHPFFTYHLPRRAFPARRTSSTPAYLNPTHLRAYTSRRRTPSRRLPTLTHSSPPPRKSSRPRRCPISTTRTLSMPTANTDVMPHFDADAGFRHFDARLPSDACYDARFNSRPHPPRSSLTSPAHPTSLAHSSTFSPTRSSRLLDCFFPSYSSHFSLLVHYTPTCPPLVFLFTIHLSIACSAT